MADQDPWGVAAVEDDPETTKDPWAVASVDDDPQVKSASETPAGATGPLPKVGSVPQPNMTVPSYRDTLKAGYRQAGDQMAAADAVNDSSGEKAGPYATHSQGYLDQQLKKPIKDYADGVVMLKDGVVQMGSAWGDNFDFNSKDAKQGLTKTINGLMTTTIPIAAAEFGGNPAAARALAAGILGGYVTGEAARKGAKILGLDPDSQDLASALGNVVGGAVAGHMAYGQPTTPRNTQGLGTYVPKAGKLLEAGTPAEQHVHPDYHDDGWGVEKEEDFAPKEETGPTAKKPAAKQEEVTHPSGKVTGIDEKSDLPIVDRSKPSAEEKAEPEPKKKEVLSPEKTPGKPEAKPEAATIEGKFQKVGAKDEGTGRMILQPTDSATQNQELATEGHKEILPGIKQLVASTDGAKMAGVRPEKDAERTQEKIGDEKKPAATIPDYSAMRTAVDTPQAKDDLVRLIKDKYPVVKEKDEFDKGSPGEKFPAHMLQVQSSNGATHEVQILPKEVAAIAEPTHDLYEQARGGDKDAQAELKTQNAAAMEKFLSRNGSTGAEGKTGPTPVNAKPTEELVKPKVLSTGHDGEVLKPVVALDSVPVVNNLSGKKGAAEGALHDKAMLANRDAVDGEGDISSSSQVTGASVNGLTGDRARLPLHGEASDNGKPLPAGNTAKRDASTPVAATGAKFSDASKTGLNNEGGTAAGAGRFSHGEPIPPLERGTHVVLPDGRSAIVNFYDGKVTKRARVTTEDGTKIDSVSGKDLVPVVVQKQNPGENWTGFDLDKTLAHYNKFKGPLDIGKPIGGEVAEQLKRHLAAGDNVRILTARVGNDPYGKIARQIQAWTQHHFGQAVPVTNTKDQHMQTLYDDRAVAVQPNTGKILGGEHREIDGTGNVSGSNQKEANGGGAGQSAVAPAKPAGGSDATQAAAAPAKPASDAAPTPAKEAERVPAPKVEQPRTELGRYDVIPSEIVPMRVSDIRIDPKRFQFKLNKDAASGASDTDRNWNPLLADPIRVWLDPANGKYYVVNGHHRMALAKRNKIDTLNAQVIPPEDAQDAGEARALGALVNIAQGRGTAVDAAKYFRETSITPAELEQKGVSLSEQTASQGLALAKLSDRLFDQVVSGKMKIGRGVVIGDATADPDAQDAIMKLIERKEASGKSVPNDVVAEMARRAKAASTESIVQDSLFGFQEMTKNLLLEEGEISDYIRKQISQEKRLFGAVSDENKAERLGKAGNTIKAGENARIAEQAGQAAEIYDRLSTTAGEVSDVIHNAASELAKGKDANGVKSRAYEAVRASLSATLDRIQRPRDSGIQKTNESASRLRRGPLPGDQPLPGFEGTDAERAGVNADEQGKQLTAELNTSKGSIDKLAGEMERESPLFRGTGPQKELFARLKIGTAQMHPGGDANFDWHRLANAMRESGSLDDLEDWIHDEVELQKLEDDALREMEEKRKPREDKLEDGRPDAMTRLRNQDAAAKREPSGNAAGAKFSLLPAPEHGIPMVEVNPHAYGVLLKAGVFQAQGWDGLNLPDGTRVVPQLEKFLEDHELDEAGQKNVRALVEAVGAAVDPKYGGLILLGEHGDIRTAGEEQAHAWDSRNLITQNVHIAMNILGHPLAFAVRKALGEMGYDTSNPGEMAAEIVAKAISGQFEDLGVPAPLVHTFLRHVFQAIAEVRGARPLKEIPNSRAIVQNAAKQAIQWHEAIRGKTQGTRNETGGGGSDGTSDQGRSRPPPEALSRISDIAQRVKDWSDDTPTPGDKQREMMRQTRGEMDRAIAVAAEYLKPARRAWSMRSHADTTAFINAIEQGNISSLPAKDQKLANYLHSNFYAPLVAAIRAERPQVLQNLIQHYFARWWKNPGMASRRVAQVLSGKRPFAGSGSFTKMRTVPTFQDGINMGLEPHSWNPVDISLHKFAEMGQFLMAFKTLNMMKDAGTAKMVRPGGKRPDGWTQLDDRIGTVMSVDPQTKEMVIRGHYYAPSDAARVFNNYVSRGFSGAAGHILGPVPGAIYDSLAWVNNNMNALQLGISAFHFTTTALLSPVSDIALGIRQMSEGKPIKGMGNTLMGLSTVGSIARTAINGHKMLREYLAPGTYRKVEAEANAIATSGGRAKMNPLEIKPWQKLLSNIRNGEPVAAAGHLFGSALAASVAPVMDAWVPRMKLGAFYQMAHDTLEEGMLNHSTPEEIRRKLDRDWDSADNRYGQVVYAAKFWHRIVADTMHIAMRSVGWNHGSVAEGGGGLQDLGKAAAQAAQGKAPELSNRAAFVFALPFYFGVMGAIATYLWQHRAPESWKDLFYPMTPGGQRISPPGYMKDYIGFGFNPVGTAVNKTSAIFEAMGEALRNEDFYHTEIRHKDDPFVQQAAQFASWAAGKAEPFSMQGTQKLLAGTGEDAHFDWHHPVESTHRIAAAIGRHLSDMALGNLGFQPAPGYIQNTKALTLARQYGHENRPPGTKTQDAEDHMEAMHAAATLYRQNPDNAEEIVQSQYVDTGKLTPRDAVHAAKLADEDPLVVAVNSGDLSTEQALNVYSVATEEEREGIRAYVERKVARIDNDPKLSENRKNQLQLVADELLNGVKEEDNPKSPSYRNASQ